MPLSWRYMQDQSSPKMAQTNRSVVVSGENQLYPPKPPESEVKVRYLKQNATFRSCGSTSRLANTTQSRESQALAQEAYSGKALMT